MIERVSDANYEPIMLDGQFRFVQSRLKGGAVYANEDQSLFLRAGNEQEVRTEQILTLSLAKKGFPVPKVLAHGIERDRAYFIESSLGSEPLGVTFGREYAESGKVSEASFEQLLGVIDRYAVASFGPKNRQHRAESLRDLCHYSDVKAQFGLDDTVDVLMTKVEKRLADVPAAIVNTDLGPYNIMPKGVIDFEYIQSGPIGYDLVTAPSVGYFFPDIDGFHHKITYKFTDEQLEQYISLVESRAGEAGLESPFNYHNEYMFLKTFWAAARPRGYEFTPYPESNQEAFWSGFRAAILHDVIDQYADGEQIDYTTFPARQVDNQGTNQ